ncbi:MAG TPA: glycosyltransferase [Solirubrobacteraceae bacterium]|nr:glycosyltransferase [Solirubrobacteraceae bacterium]
MRIAHVISSPEGIGGAERVLLELLKAGAERGWEQRVLHPFLKGGESGLAQCCPPRDYHSAPCSRWQQLPGLWRWIGHELFTYRPDIVHVHLFHAAVLVASLPRPFQARLLLTHHHGSRYVEERQPAREIADRACGRRYDVVVAVSESTRRMLADRYHYPESKLVTIPNGWSGSPVAQARRPAHRIVCVANLRRQKGHDVLLSAFAQVVRQLPDAELLLVGDGPLRAGLSEQARRLGIERSVQFTGAADDVWPLLAEADVFALASRYEPLGLAVLEAMAAGLPVVAAAVDGLTEIVEDGVSGYLVPRDDPDALAKKLICLFGSPDQMRSMAMAGKTKAADYGADTMRRRYSELYMNQASVHRIAREDQRQRRRGPGR